MPHQPSWLPIVCIICVLIACALASTIVTYLPWSSDRTTHALVERSLIDPLTHWVKALGRGALAKRRNTNPSRDELLWSSVGFGGVAYISFFLRVLNRCWVIKKFQIEDYGMCAVMLLFTNLLVWINVSARFNTNLYPPEQAAAILTDPQEVANRVFGSKIVIGLEQSMLFTIWGCKLCIWAFLFRVHRNTRYKTVLYIICTYIWLGLFLIEVFYFFGFCQPFTQYWAVPVSNSECATYHQYSILQIAFNVSSDILLVLMPMPLVWKARLPLKRKLILTGVFSLAVLAIVCAVLNKYYNFASPTTTTYKLWYICEASVCVAVANLICIWQLLQHTLKVRSFDDTRFSIRDDNGVRISPASGFIINWARQSWAGMGLAKSEGGVTTLGTGTTDMELGDGRGRGREDGRRNTQFTLTGDDGADAGPAILYRSVHNIA